MDERKGLLSHLKRSLSRTREVWGRRLGAILAETSASDDDWDALEEALLGADFGVEAAQRLLEMARGAIRDGNRDCAAVLTQELAALLKERQVLGSGRYSVSPWVIMVVGVNGVGKTTTIGKLAYQLRQSGKKVLLGAADTFRAGAIEQLEIWGERSGAEVIKHGPGQDPSGVVFDAAQVAQTRRADVLIIDTAGRLHNKVNLIEELKKMRRVLSRVLDGAPHETLLVLDANTGQNGVAQAGIYREAIGVDGIVLTKLDGTAKGGVVVRIQQELLIPVEYVGVGEGIDDLQPFDPDAFAQALFG